MRILRATHYPHVPRTVIVVCENPEDPESIHPDGSPHSGSPPPATDLSLSPWEWCHDCTYNWRVREFLWTGHELYTTSSSGKRRLKTNAELLKEIRTQLPPQQPATEISGLVGLTLSS